MRSHLPLALSLPILATGCKTFVPPLEELVDDQRAEAPDVALLAGVLEARVDDRGRVDYAALAADREDLERFYAQFAEVGPTTHPELFPTREDRFAYWLNAYNAAVLVSVTRLFPLESVEDLGAPWYLFFGPPTTRFFFVRTQGFDGDELSLYTVEHARVLDEFEDPRAHFALNCASAGCPRLPREPFRAADLELQLHLETRLFFSEPRNLAIDHEAREIRLSSLLDWYADEFVADLERRGVEPATPLEFATRHAPAEIAAELRGAAADYTVRYVPYDWRLNGVDLERYPVPGLDG